MDRLLYHALELVVWLVVAVSTGDKPIASGVFLTKEACVQHIESFRGAVQLGELPPELRVSDCTEVKVTVPQKTEETDPRFQS